MSSIFTTLETCLDTSIQFLLNFVYCTKSTKIEITIKANNKIPH